jgi:cyclopropane fatty-acyl-phospholipid synthase-like methyltransferase
MSYLETRYNFVKSSNDAFYDFKAQTLNDVIAGFRKKPARSFVDLGAGCGDLVRAMKRVANLESSAGVELDEAMVKEADKIGGGEYVHGSITKSNAALKNRFDVVASLEVFEHLTHDEHAQAFKTYQAYATDGATGVILVPNAAHPFLSGWISWSDYTHHIISQEKIPTDGGYLFI